MFLYHILTHVENNPRGNKVEGGISCLWAGCKSKYPSLYKLREHIRVHTKEKIIACPDCGSMFSSNTKFHDHCKRQIPLEGKIRNYGYIFNEIYLLMYTFYTYSTRISVFPLQ